MSTSWCSLSTNSMQQSPFKTRPLRKWCLISMCLVLECMTRFLVRLVALVLSHFKWMWSRFTQKSSSCCFIKRLWAQQLPTAIYYAFAVESATQACFLQFQDTSELPKRWHVPLVLFLSSLHPTKSKSEKSIRLKEVPLGYHKPTLVVPLRYLIILLIVVKWDSLRFAWYLAHKQTLNIILSWLAVK